MLSLSRHLLLSGIASSPTLARDSLFTSVRDSMSRAQGNRSTHDPRIPCHLHHRHPAAGDGGALHPRLWADARVAGERAGGLGLHARHPTAHRRQHRRAGGAAKQLGAGLPGGEGSRRGLSAVDEIGRAYCSERVWTYGSIPVLSVYLKKKNKK